MGEWTVTMTARTGTTVRVESCRRKASIDRVIRHTPRGGPTPFHTKIRYTICQRKLAPKGFSHLTAKRLSHWPLRNAYKSAARLPVYLAALNFQMPLTMSDA